MKKTAKGKYRSRMAAAIHETMTDAFRAGVIDKATMREFDASCLTTVEVLSGNEIQAIREREGVSQAVLAHFLNVRPVLVSQWERGIKRPSGPSLKLLAIIKDRGLEAIR